MEPEKYYFFINKFVLLIVLIDWVTDWFIHWLNK